MYGMIVLNDYDIFYFNKFFADQNEYDVLLADDVMSADWNDYNVLLNDWNDYDVMAADQNDYDVLLNIWNDYDVMSAD